MEFTKHVGPLGLGHANDLVEVACCDCCNEISQDSVHGCRVRGAGVWSTSLKSKAQVVRTSMSSTMIPASDMVAIAEEIAELASLRSSRSVMLSSVRDARQHGCMVLGSSVGMFDVWCRVVVLGFLFSFV